MILTFSVVYMGWDAFQRVIDVDQQQQPGSTPGVHQIILPCHHHHSLPLSNYFFCARTTECFPRHTSESRSGVGLFLLLCQDDSAALDPPAGPDDDWEIILLVDTRVKGKTPAVIVNMTRQEGTIRVDGRVWWRLIMRWSKHVKSN